MANVFGDGFEPSGLWCRFQNSVFAFWQSDS
jgi:hypothetical protein